VPCGEGAGFNRPHDREAAPTPHSRFRGIQALDSGSPSKRASPFDFGGQMVNENVCEVGSVEQRERCGSSFQPQGGENDFRRESYEF
jgi:hypothetical protein